MYTVLQDMTNNLKAVQTLDPLINTAALYRFIHTPRTHNIYKPLQRI